jgi:hypothetical protein
MTSKHGQGNKKCLVLGPIKTPQSPERRRLEDIKEFLLDPVLEPLGFTVELPHEVPDSGIITNYIINRLMEDELTVCDLSDGNPNVYYEVALRHVTSKPCLHLIAEGQQVPFDLAHIKYIEYNLQDPRSIKKTKADLAKHLEMLLSDPGSVQYPTTNAFALADLGKSDNAVDQAASQILQQVGSVTEGLACLEAAINMLAQGGGTYDATPRFLPRTATHHQFVHRIRDLCVQQLGRLDRFLPPDIAPDAPHPIFEQVQSEMISILEDVVRIFMMAVAPGAKIWACLRDLRGDSRYHSLVRAGRYTPLRGETSEPMHEKDSITVRRLQESFNSGRCVILTGSSFGPQMWEHQLNDQYGEDKSVMMSAIMAKSWDSDVNNWGRRKIMMILGLNSDQENLFGEQHIPLMQAITDNLSLLVNVLLRRWEKQYRIPPVQDQHIQISPKAE